MKEILRGFDDDFHKLQLAVEILEQKFRSRLFKKKPADLEEAIENKQTEKVISPDGLDELRRLAKSNNDKFP